MKSRSCLLCRSQLLVLVAALMLVLLCREGHGAKSVGALLNPDNGHIYHLLKANDGVSGITWSEAEQAAESLGGHLVTINDAEENSWITSVFPDPYLWIGFNDANSEGNFVWSSGQSTTYTNWYPGEPNDFGDGEDFTHIYNFAAGGGQWNDFADENTNGEYGVFGIAEIARDPLSTPTFYQIEGSVNRLVDPSNLTGDFADRGDVVRGLLVYDSFAVDEFPQSPEFGFYAFPTAPADFFLSVNGFRFRRDQGVVINVRNDVELRGSVSDSFSVLGYGSPSTFPFSQDGFSFFAIEVRDEQQPTNLLTDDTLPTTLDFSKASSITGFIGSRNADDTMGWELHLDNLTISTIPTPRPVPEAPIPTTSGYNDLERPAGSTAKNAVILVHGWKDSPDLFTTTNADKDLLKTNMQGTLEEALGSRLHADYDVFSYDWSEHAADEMNTIPIVDGGKPSEQIKIWAAAHGAHLAGQIADLGYSGHVHFIAHSLGGRVIDRATFSLEEIQWPGTLHATFLDAYTPDNWEDEFGIYADFADSYYFDNFGAFPTNTEDTMRYALNVDITEIVDESGDRSDDHKWPVRWYEQSIARIDPAFEGFGYPLSREANDSEWPASELIGSTFALPLSSREERTLRQIRDQREHDPVRSFLNSSTTGEVIADGQTMEMRTGSAVWFNMTLDISNVSNFVEFEYEFMSDAAGLLSVWVNDDVVGLVEEEFSFDGAHSSGLLLLSENLQPGNHLLSFRLDPRTSDMSVIELSHITSGLLVRTLAGDYNDDGVVDAADYTVWRDALGSLPGSLPNDADGGMIGQAQYNTWRDNFGASLSASSLPDNIAVPEPSSDLILCLANLAAWLVCGFARFPMRCTQSSK